MKSKLTLLFIIVFCLFENIAVFSVDNEETAIDVEWSYNTLMTIDDSLSVDFSKSNVSRGEFVHNITKILSINTTSNAELCFDDVSSEADYYNSVAFVLEAGWISKSEKFYPDEFITFEQAIKIAVHAIGGGDCAGYYGGWPVGYWKVAHESELLSDIEIPDGGLLTQEQMCILLYNVLTSPTYEMPTINLTNPKIVFGGKPLMESIHKMYLYEGILTANSVTDTGDELVQRDDTVHIGQYEFYDNFGCDKYLGYNVRVLYTEKNDKKTVEYVMPYANEVSEFNNHDFSGVDNTYVYYSDGEKEQKCKLNEAFKYVYNGKTKLITSSDLSSLFDKDTTVFTLIDNNLDGRIDVVKAEQYKYTIVSSYDLYDGLIKDKYSSANNIDISDDDCIYEVYAMTNGKLYDASIKEITEDIVVASSVSDDGKYLKIILCFDEVSGRINEMHTDDSIMVIGSEQYYTSEYYINYFPSRIGEEKNCYIGINNEIVADSTTSSVMKYAWLIKTKFLKYEDKYMVQLFNQNSEMLILELEKKLYLDGEIKTNEVAFGKLGTIDTDEKRFIKYSVNNDGRINKIDLADNRIGDVSALSENRIDTNSLTMNFMGTYSTRPMSLLSDNSDSTRSSKFNFKNVKYIFVIPEEEARHDENEYRIASFSELNLVDNTNINTMMGFDVQLSGSAKAIVVTAGNLLNSSGGTSQYGVVEKVHMKLDYDESAAHAIYVSDGTNYNVIYMNEDMVAKYGLPNPGDIIKYSTNYLKSVNFINVVFDFKNYQTSGTTDENTPVAFKSGFVYAYSDNYLYYFEPDMTDKWKPSIPDELNFSMMRNVNVSSNKLVFIDAVRSSDGSQIKSVVVEPAPITRLSGSLNSSESGTTFVVNHVSYNQGMMTYAYNIEYR